ncbi:MAG: hypothetical protein ACJ79K_06800 [Gemmatimonadaceae bacterium]
MTSIELPSTAVEMSRETARSAIALNGRPAIVFGAFFIIAGCGIGARALIGGTDGMHAPRVIVAICGALFALAGLWVSANGVLDLRRKRDAAERAAATPRQPWLWDYPWSHEGIGNDTSREIVSAFGFAIFMAIFLTPFHWIGFAKDGGPRIFGVFALLFDLAVIGLLVRAVRLVMMRRRYGRSWLRFGHFPFLAGEPLEASLAARDGLAALTRLTATLQCVQERYEDRGSGRNRSRQVICYQLSSETKTVEKSASGTFDFSFAVPADAPNTALSERPARFWELVLTSDDIPGVDYAAKFLVPVYARR